MVPNDIPVSPEDKSVAATAPQLAREARVLPGRLTTLSPDFSAIARWLVANMSSGHRNSYLKKR
jgi:hypothetical protein